MKETFWKLVDTRGLSPVARYVLNVVVIATCGDNRRFVLDLLAYSSRLEFAQEAGLSSCYT